MPDKRRICINCFHSREEKHRDWVNKDMPLEWAKRKGINIDDPSNWSEYSELWCMRYPQSIEVQETHYCGEFEPDSIGGEEVESET